MSKNKETEPLMDQPKVVARLCLDPSDPKSIEAIDLLREAGFRVLATGVSVFEPELHVGGVTYSGMGNIRRFVSSVGQIPSSIGKAKDQASDSAGCNGM
ncbi:MAG: hypothetical protein HYU80_01075 [Candidatus Blackburnbacteria bacterium]|nr:hypothetical protein [Candidatus Blackburnbacteria bacterium]